MSVTDYHEREDEKMAPLQKRAIFSLVAGVIIAAVVITILLMQGDVTTFDDTLNTRMLMYAAIVGVPLIYLILVNISLRKPTQIDERDRLILDKSRTVQWFAVILSLAAWTISLTEVFHNEGQLPVEYLNLIFMSILIVSPLAQSLGIILGYWGMNRNG